MPQGLEISSFVLCTFAIVAILKSYMSKSLLSSLLQKKYISRNGGEGKENESPVRVLPQTFLLAQ